MDLCKGDKLVATSTMRISILGIMVAQRIATWQGSEEEEEE